jgi:hypothetical protein
MSTLTSIDIGLINAAIQIRKTSELGVQRMMRSLQERGYLDRYPLPSRRQPTASSCSTATTGWKPRADWRSPGYQPKSTKT